MVHAHVSVSQDSASFQKDPCVNQNEHIRHDWTFDQVAALYEKPLMDLLFEAQSLHRQYFKANQVQLSTLLNIKEGGCSEDCKYCSQSSHYATETKAEKLMDEDKVRQLAIKAKKNGAQRFCMGAAWRQLKDRDVEKVVRLIHVVKQQGLETCMTLGMLKPEQAQALKEAGLDYYNHNLDTSEEYYDKVVTTHSFQDRLDTLDCVKKAGINVCSGGIIGMGEERKDRMGLLMSLANLPHHPESVPINMLVPIEGTPFEKTARLDHFEMVKTIAVARLMMPGAYVRLSAGREKLSDTGQALCFMAGANSIFYGERLLTTSNPQINEDLILFARLGIDVQEKNHQLSS